MRNFNPSIPAYMNMNKIKLESKKETPSTGLLSPVRMGSKNKEDKMADPAVRVAYHVKAIRDKRQNRNGV